MIYNLFITLKNDYLDQYRCNYQANFNIILVKFVIKFSFN